MRVYQDKNLLNKIIGFSVALGGALVANLIHMPLPWLLGALFAVALWKINGLPCGSDVRCRQAGQWVIGTSLGLHFTTEMWQLLNGLYGSLLLGVTFSISLGVIGALVLYYWLKVDFATAWFSSMVGGASEMVTMAEGYEGKSDFVASAHTLRVMLVVTTIPFAFKYLNIHGDMVANHEQIYGVSWLGLLALMAVSSTAAMVLQRVRFPVAWVLAPLAITAVLTLMDIHLSALPEVVKHAGQVFIGWSLGDKFTKGFFRRSPKFLSVVAVYNLIGLALTVGMAVVFSHFNHVDIPTMILSLSSGGIAEMTITAESVHLGVAIVAMFHVLRMTAVVLLTQPMFILVKKWFGVRDSAEVEHAHKKL